MPCEKACFFAWRINSGGRETPNAFAFFDFSMRTFGMPRTMPFIANFWNKNWGVYPMNWKIVNFWNKWYSCWHGFEKDQSTKISKRRNLSGTWFEAGRETIGRTDGIRNTIELHKIFVNPGTGARTRRKELQAQWGIKIWPLQSATSWRLLSKCSCFQVCQSMTMARVSSSQYVRRAARRDAIYSVEFRWTDIWRSQCERIHAPRDNV